MTLVVLAVVCAGFTAESNRPVTTVVPFTMVAVQATNEGRGGQKAYDPDIEDLKPYLNSRPYDTFRKLKSASGAAHYQKEEVVPLTERYTLHILIQSEDTRHRLKVRVYVEEKMEKNGKTRMAVDTTGYIVPDKNLVLGGMALPKGELVIVLSFKGSGQG